MAKLKLPPLPLTGGCTCEAVRFEITALPLLVYACHCTECQRWSGSAFSLSMPVKADSFSVTGVPQNRFAGSARAALKVPIGSAAIVAAGLMASEWRGPRLSSFVPERSMTPRGCGRLHMSICGARRLGRESQTTRSASISRQKTSGHSPANGSKCGKQIEKYESARRPADKPLRLQDRRPGRGPALQIDMGLCRILQRIGMVDRHVQFAVDHGGKQGVGALQQF